MAMEIQVVDYNPKWKEQFEKKQKKLTDLLESKVISIAHIGSTSVPGLKACISIR